MNDEAAFLRAIEAAPNDRGRRLVYADWLEDRADPRGELIRIEEEMRQLPVFADRFWQLKPRRNELRARTAADWLTTLRYGTDVQPVFAHGIPEGWRERWRLIREFVKRWHGIPMGDVGGRLSEVHATEQRLGRQLPPSLRKYVAFTYDVASQGKGGITRRDDISMELMNGDSALSIMVEDGQIRCAIPYSHLSQQDPPVYAYAAWNDDDSERLPIEGTGPEAEPLSDFVLGVVDQYKTDGGQFRTWGRDDLELRKQLDAFFPIQVVHHRTTYWAATTIVHRVSRQQGRIYEGPGILVWLYDSRRHGDFNLEVCVHPSLSREAVPRFLWEYARRVTYPTGMFLTDAAREGMRDD